MKRYSLLLIGFLMCVSSYACEICGCANGNFQIGLLPNFNRGFFGYKYSFAQFNSQLKSDPTQFSHDYYKTMELWGGYKFHKVQAMAFMPYVFSHKVSDDGVTNSNGLGDLMILVNYKILSSTFLSKNEQSTIVHELYVGGGVKLPTGVNRVNTSSPDFNIGDFNSQAGTGSIDYIINATHNTMWNNSGIVTNIAYRVNTANHQGYRFGNRAFLNSAYYYTFTASQLKIKPNVGISYQSNAVNLYHGDKIDQSNGYSLNATVGLNVVRNKFGVNAIAFVPIAQNYFDGQTKLQTRMTFGLTYSF